MPVCTTHAASGQTREGRRERAPLRSAPQPSYIAERAHEAQHHAPSALPSPVARPGTMLPKQCGEAERRAISDVARLTAVEARKRRRAPLRAGPEHFMALGFFCLVLFAPQIALGLGLAVGWLVLGAFFVLTHERLGPRAQRRWHRFARRRPARAERLRRMADGAAMRWEVMLDILPESWAEQLSLPDLSQPIEARPPQQRP